MPSVPHTCIAYHYEEEQSVSYLIAKEASSVLDMIVLGFQFFQCSHYTEDYSPQIKKYWKIIYTIVSE